MLTNQVRRGSGAPAAPVKRTRWCAVVALSLPVLALALPARADAVGGGPPLPPQPGVVTTLSNCKPPAAPARGWTEVTHGESPSAVPAEQITVDPSLPCRMYRAGDAQSLDRSLDGGKTWRRVFHDDMHGTPGDITDPTCGAIPAVSGCRLNTPEFAASSLAVAASGATVVMGEVGNGDAVVTSTDAGTTWQLRNGGITGVAGQPVQRVVVAPSDSSVQYAIVGSPAGVPNSTVAGGLGLPGSTATGGPVGLYATTDGGGAWSPEILPNDGGLLLTALQVDPSDPTHLWAVLQAATGWALLEGTGYGRSWSVVASTPRAPQGSVAQLVVTRSTHHPLRLLLVGAFSTGVVIFSDDDGATFKPAPISRSFNLGTAFVPPVIAADPGDADDMVYAANAATVRTGGSGNTVIRVQSYFTHDGFDTVTPGPWVPVIGALGVVSPYPSATAPPEALAQADRAGGFYLAVETDCSQGAVSQTGCGSTSGFRSSWWRTESPFRQPPVAPPGGGGTPVLGVPLPGGRGTVGAPMLQMGQCPIPPSMYGYKGGTVAYDGRDLLYTMAGETGPVAYSGIIHKMNPATCASTGDVVVQFTAADLAELGQSERYGGGSRPSIGGISYDARRNVIWAALYLYNPGSSGFGPAGETSLLRVEGADPNAVHSTARAHLAFASPRGCGFWVSYDYSADALWTCSTTDRQGLPSGWPGDRIRASDGASLPPCSLSASIGPATLAAVGAGRLYVQEEDDTTVTTYDSVTCSAVAHYAHRTFDEPLSEDEQMVCDPVSFGPDSASPLQTAVLWLRDAEADLITAYAIPDTCPLPTVTRYLGPVRAQTGQTVSMCARLTLRGLGSPVAHRPLAFTVNGAGLGAAVTDASGTACLPLTVDLPGGRYTAEARFAGDQAYLPSGDLGGITVPSWAAAFQRFPVAAALVPPDAFPSVPPSPVQAPAAQGQPSVATQAQTEAQGQTQMQAQVQSQAQASTQAQPSAMMQRQRQTQVAFRSAEAAVSHLATGSRMHRAASVGIALRQLPAIGVVLICAVPLLLRGRSAVAPAISRRGRRDTTIGMSRRNRRS